MYSKIIDTRNGKFIRTNSWLHFDLDKKTVEVSCKNKDCRLYQKVPKEKLLLPDVCPDCGEKLMTNQSWVKKKITFYFKDYFKAEK